MRLSTSLALAAAILLGAGGGARAADKVVFQLGWIPTGDIAPVYVGLAEGYYAEQGLDVGIAAGRGSMDAVTRVAIGQADIASIGTGAALQAAAESAVPVKIVMSQYTKMPDAVLTWKGSGIASIRDVEGKRVGSTPFSVSNSFFPEVLTLAGVDPASVTLVKADANAVVGLLASGRVDATINWIGLVPGFRSALEETGKEIVVLPWSEVGYEGYGFALIASDKIIKERPDVLRRFLAAYRKVLEAAVRDPSLVGAAIKASVPDTDEAIDTAEAAACVPLIDNEITRRDGLGALNPALVRATWVWLAKGLKYPLDKIDPEAWVDRSFLPK